MRFAGSLLYHFGLTETIYYTVLFGVSRSLGVCAQNIIARILGQPILRPKSVTTEWLQDAVSRDPQTPLPAASTSSRRIL